MDFPKHEDGYGIILEDAHWTRDAAEQLYQFTDPQASLGDCGEELICCSAIHK